MALFKLTRLLQQHLFNRLLLLSSWLHISIRACFPGPECSPFHQLAQPVFLSPGRQVQCMKAVKENVSICIYCRTLAALTAQFSAPDLVHSVRHRKHCRYQLTQMHRAQHNAQADSAALINCFKSLLPSWHHPPFLRLFLTSVQPPSLGT